jgi:hypothetical protein
VKFVEFLVRICFATNVKEGDEEEEKNKQKPRIVIMQRR